MSGNNPIDDAESLLAAGRAAEALEITQPLADAREPRHPALATHSAILKVLGRHADALPYDLKATERYANSPVAWHNLAATLADLGRGAEARAAIEKALTLGGDHAVSWAVYARSLLAVGALDAADTAYRQALHRAPDSVDLAVEYANLVWMRSGDLTAAQAVLDAALQAGGAPGDLVRATAKLLDAAGDTVGAARLLAAAVERLPPDVGLTLAAAHAAVEARALDQALFLAELAATWAPDRADVLNELAIVHLARGQADRALAAAQRGLASAPGDQSLLGWAATAAQIVGDPMYEELYDYDKVVGVYDIAAPKGWASVEAYLADLATVLRTMHPYARHPFHQSIRQGSQTLQPLTASTDPVLRGFFEAIDAPIRRHMARLGRGGDPHRRRNTGDYRIQDAWSVLLQPGGFHQDHFHPRGWLSSAFYVEVPDQALAKGGQEGWLRFGQPPIALDPPLAPGKAVQPKPGRLVLFPSYMWHGTVPFTTDERRMTLAFDAVPV